MRRIVLAFCLVLGMLSTALAWQGEGKREEPLREASFGAPPLVRLIRDPHTRTELAVTAHQAKAIDDLLAKVDGPLWRIRDYPGSKVAAEAKPLLEELQRGLATILDDQQEGRLRQILRQIQSWRGLIEPEMAQAIVLRESQLTTLKAIFADTAAKQTAIEQEVKKSGGKLTETQTAALRKLQEEERSQVAATLDSDQQKRLAELVGTPFDFTPLRHLWARAPEFAPATTWLPAEELKLSQQRGKVVVVHFFAFGCINCIHNYPWYREWRAKYAPSDVTIIGIHTPETTAEREVKTLEAKLKENRLDFPVAVDNEKANWNAWGNSMWPSVYLIDKEGYVRAWWYGELDWQGAGGHKIMEQRIDALLKETPR